MHAVRLRRACVETLELLIGAPFDEQAIEQASLPGAYGGLSLALPSKLRAAAAFHTAEDTHAAAVVRLSQELGRPTQGCGADAAAAEQARESLFVGS